MPNVIYSPVMPENIVFFNEVAFLRRTKSTRGIPTPNGGRITCDVRENDLAIVRSRYTGEFITEPLFPEHNECVPRDIIEAVTGLDDDKRKINILYDNYNRFLPKAILTINEDTFRKDRIKKLVVPEIPEINRDKLLTNLDADQTDAFGHIERYDFIRDNAMVDIPFLHHMFYFNTISKDDFRFMIERSLDEFEFMSKCMKARRLFPAPDVFKVDDPAIKRLRHMFERPFVNMTFNFFVKSSGRITGPLDKKKGPFRPVEILNFVNRCHGPGVKFNSINPIGYLNVNNLFSSYYALCNIINTVTTVVKAAQSGMFIVGDINWFLRELRYAAFATDMVSPGAIVPKFCQTSPEYPMIREPEFNASTFLVNEFEKYVDDLIAMGRCMKRFD